MLSGCGNSFSILSLIFCFLSSLLRSPFLCNSFFKTCYFVSLQDSGAWAAVQLALSWGEWGRAAGTVSRVPLRMEVGHGSQQLSAELEPRAGWTLSLHIKKRWCSESLPPSSAKDAPLTGFFIPALQSGPFNKKSRHVTYTPPFKKDETPNLHELSGFLWIMILSFLVSTYGCCVHHHDLTASGECSLEQLKPSHWRATPSFRGLTVFESPVVGGRMGDTPGGQKRLTSG